MNLDIQHQNGRLENVWVSEGQIRSAVERYRPEPQVIHERPHLNMGHVAGAAIGVVLIGGIVYALSRSRLGQLVLFGAVIWFLWTCNDIVRQANATPPKQYGIVAAPGQAGIVDATGQPWTYPAKQPAQEPEVRLAIPVEPQVEVRRAQLVNAHPHHHVAANK